MKRRSLLTTVGCAALALAACGGQTTRAEELGAALDDADVSLDGAVGAAQAEFPDGQIIGAELEVEDGQAVYELEVVIDGQVSEVTIDPDSGAILSVEQENETERLVACEVTISLEQAIAAAQQGAGGRATSVEREGCGFEVEVLKGETFYEVEVGADGQVLSIEKEEEKTESENDEDGK